MIIFNNEYPTGMSAGPASAMPKQMLRFAGESARLSRKDTKARNLFKHIRFEKDLTR